VLLRLLSAFVETSVRLPVLQWGDVLLTGQFRNARSLGPWSLHGIRNSRLEKCRPPILLVPAGGSKLPTIDDVPRGVTNLRNGPSCEVTTRLRGQYLTKLKGETGRALTERFATLPRGTLRSFRRDDERTASSAKFRFLLVASIEFPAPTP
jgi:hypothetical protein